MQYSDSKRKSIIEESIGKTFGHLTVIKFVEFRSTPRGGKVPMVLVRCSKMGCTNETVKSLWDVRSGKSKTCSTGGGHPIYEDREIPAFNNIYKFSYKKRALDAGIPFELSEEQFKELCEQPCHYCSVTPDEFSCNSGWARTARRGKIPSGKYVSEWKYNGLDRVIPNKGYVLDNVVPCCGICNHAKHTMSYEDFTNWLDRVADTRTKNKLVFVT